MTRNGEAHVRKVGSNITVFFVIVVVLALIGLAFFLVPLNWQPIVEPALRWLGGVDAAYVVLALVAISLISAWGIKRRIYARTQRQAAEQINRMIPVLEALEKNQPYPFQKPRAEIGEIANPFQNTVLITVHGVNSENEGFAHLVNELSKRLPGIRCFYVHYDASTIRKLSPDVRGNAYYEVYNQFKGIAHDLKKEDRVFVVAHSFGTVATVYSLQSVIEHFKIDGIVWVGCALSRIQNWNWLHSLYAKGSRVAHLNIVRPFDLVVAFARFVGGGDAGSKGFLPMGQRDHLPEETFKSGGHTGYVNDVDEIVALIGGSRPNFVSEFDWKRTLSIFKRVMLFLRRRF
jgi:hypothetical protein